MNFTSSSGRLRFAALTVLLLSLVCTAWLWTNKGQVESRIDPQTIVNQDGHRFFVKEGHEWSDTALFTYPADTNETPFVSNLRVYENDRQLGPWHSGHAAIGTDGLGRYSHWNGILLFSSGDRSDPRSNGYEYRLDYEGVPTTLMHSLRIGFLAVSLTLFGLSVILFRKTLAVRSVVLLLGFGVGAYAVADMAEMTPAHRYLIPASSITAQAGPRCVADASGLPYSRSIFYLAADSNEAPDRSSLRLVLNGEIAGTPHANHAAIGNEGNGRFSHWGDKIIFSLPDDIDQSAIADGLMVAYRPQLKPYIRYGLLGVLALTVSLFFLSLSGFFIGWDRQFADRRVTTQPQQKQSLKGLAGLFAQFLALPIVLAMIILVPLLALYASASGDSHRRLNYQDVMSMMTYEQQLRTEKLKGSDVVFFGDSSCLTGVDVDLMNRLSDRHYTNLCTLAFLGPKGHTKILQNLPITTPPPTFVYMLHPVGYQREPSWIGRVNWLDTSRDEINASDIRSWKRFTEWIYENILSGFIYTPMDGQYGLYYGNRETLRRNIEKTGMFIDPGTGLENVPRMSPFGIGNADPENFDYREYCPRLENIAPNAEYWDHLGDLKDFLTKRGVKKFYFLPAQVFARCETPDYKRDLDAVMAAHKEFFGDITLEIIDPDIDIPYGQFSTTTHLNRYGRKNFTLAVLKALEG